MLKNALSVLCLMKGWMDFGQTCTDQGYFVYLRGRLWGPVPMENTLFFQFDQENSQPENIFQ